MRAWRKILNNSNKVNWVNTMSFVISNRKMTENVHTRLTHTIALHYYHPHFKDNIAQLVCQQCKLSNALYGELAEICTMAGSCCGYHQTMESPMFSTTCSQCFDISWYCHQLGQTHLHQQPHNSLHVATKFDDEWLSRYPWLDHAYMIQSQISPD